MPASVGPHPAGTAALIVAHPGHELRVHGWVERARPTTFVLTDGSGGSGRSRLATTRRILRAAGAGEGSIFGRMSDRQFYESVLQHQSRVFTSLVDELVQAFLSLDIDLVVSDAKEDYNSTHDICRAMVDAAVVIVANRRRRPLASYDFLLVGRPDTRPARRLDHAIRVDLDDGALARKLAAARNYPELAAEVEVALRRFGAEAFRVEWLRPVTEEWDRGWPMDDVPFYEQYGARQVAAGVYTEVLRARDHVVPLVATLQRHAREQIACSR